jgi:hypothetical protein
MASGVRKGALVVHVVCSVGWLGGVVASLVLGIGVLAGEDANLVRASALALESVGWWVLVPASFASLTTGLIQSWGTSWGLLRHYWVIIKLVMNVFATGLLLLYMQTLSALADAARLSVSGDVAALRDPSPTVHAAAAVVLLLVATVLSIYKPRGVTSYGQRAQRRRSGVEPADSSRSGVPAAEDGVALH